MNKRIIGLIGGGLLLVLLALLVTSNQSVKNWMANEYETPMLEQVDLVEDQLKEIDVLVESNQLTPELAVKLKANLFAKIDATEAAVTNSTKNKLTPAQVKQLNEGLERLKSILIKYKNTLISLDNKAAQLTMAEQKKISKKMDGRRSADKIQQIIASVSQDIIDAAEDLTAEELDDSEVSDIVEQITTDLEDMTTNEEDATSTIEIDESGEIEVESENVQNNDEESTSTEPESAEEIVELSYPEGTSTDEVETEVILEN